MFIFLEGQNRLEDYCILYFLVSFMQKNYILEISAKKKCLSFQVNLFS